MQSLLVLASAAAKDPPLIDLDSTVFVQLVVFLLTAFLLSRFLFRPYLAVRAAREEGIEGARQEANRMNEEARARMADYDAKLTRAKATAYQERTKLRAEATGRERDIGQKTRRETQSALERAQAKLDSDAKAAREALAPRTREIAVEMAKRILGREVA